MADDPYAVLGLDRRATAADIRRAYFRLAHKYHPDHNRDDPDCIAQFKKVQQAFEKLSSTNAGRRPRRTPRTVVRDCAQSTSWRWTAAAAAMLLLVVAVKWAVLAWDAGEQKALAQRPADEAATLPVGRLDGSTTAPAVDPPPAEQPYDSASSQTEAVEQVGPPRPAPDNEQGDIRATKPAPGLVKSASAQLDAQFDRRALAPWNLSITPAELPKLDYHLIEPLAKGVTAVEYVLPVVNALELAAADYVVSVPKSARGSLNLPLSNEGRERQAVKLPADMSPAGSLEQVDWLPKKLRTTSQPTPPMALGTASTAMHLGPLGRSQSSATPARPLPRWSQDSEVVGAMAAPLALRTPAKAGSGPLDPLPRGIPGSPLETASPLMLEMPRPRFAARSAPLGSWPSEPRGWVPQDGEVGKLAPPPRLSPIVVPPSVDFDLSRPVSPLLPSIGTPLTDPLPKPFGIRPAAPHAIQRMEPASFGPSFGASADRTRYDSWRPSIMTKAIGDLPGRLDD